MKEGMNSRLAESLGMRNGPKKMGMKAREKMSEGMEKAKGKGAYSGDHGMDKGSKSPFPFTVIEGHRAK